MDRPGDLIPMQEAQERFGLSKMAMWRLVREGKITSYSTERDRRMKLVSASEVEAAIIPKPRPQAEPDERAKAAG